MKGPTEENGIKFRLVDFAGYTTLHGINRLSSNKRIIGKILWCCIILGCVGFCSRQIYRLCVQYASNSVNTRISIRYQKVYFPYVTFCNLNPVSFYKMNNREPNQDNMSLSYSELLQYYYNSSISGLSKDLEQQANQTKDNETMSAFTKAFQFSTEAEHKFRQSMNFFDFVQMNFTINGIKDLNPDFNDFVISCIYEGRPCNDRFFVPVFDHYYGQCYRFPSKPIISRRSGPLFALQLVVNVNESDYVPSIIQDTGIRISIHKPGTKPFLQNSGFSVSPGVQTDISIVQKSIERLQERTKCDGSNQFNSRLECFDKCRLRNVIRDCDCSIYLFEDHNTSIHPRTCYNFKQLACMEHVQQNLSGCKCLSPCSQTKYEKTITTSRWPAKSFDVVLTTIFENRGWNYSDYKDSLLAVNIFLSSLSDELTVEEPAITVENLLSNIGGTLGLWIGMSIISVGEILELAWVLCHATLSNKRIKRTDSL